MLRTALVVFFLGLLTACGGSSIEREAQRFRDLTVPPGSDIPALNKVRSSDQAAEFWWEIETDWDWRRYAKWVQPNVESRFELVTITPTGMNLRKHLPGDVYSLELRVISGGTQLHIRATFTAYPD